MRFQTGHTADVERIRIKLGRGVTGQAALERHSILAQDVSSLDNYINANPEVRSELAVPLIVKNKVIGVIDLQSETPGFFNEDHLRLLELVASRMAVAIENARLYTRVSRQAQTLTVLHEISREITSILDPDDLLERIGTLMKRVIDFQMFTILLWNPRTEQFEHRFSTRYGERVTRERNIKLGQGIIGTAAKQRAPILSPDVRKDPRYVNVHPETRSKLSVPLIYKGEVIGVIDLEHTRVNYFTDDHLRTLTTLAAQIAISIANARLYQRIHDEEQRMERDLDMARTVQLRLLPSHPPHPAHAEIAASFRPARSIGGDLYDFLDYGPAPNPDLEDPDIPGQGLVTSAPKPAVYHPAQLDEALARLPLTPTRTMLAIGDVSGKAAPAALYAALVSGILRSLAPRRLPPGRLLAALNDQLQERKLDSQYVTMLMALWDDATRTLHVANAGSVQPILIRRGDRSTNPPQPIPVEGFPLGLFTNASYDELAVKLEPGDTVLFLSDGIVDAVDAAGEQFGTERLALLFSHKLVATPTAAEVVTMITTAVAAHEGATEHFDDETLVVLQAT